MLMIVGEYLQKITNSETSIQGLAFDVSIEIAKNGISVAFESLISKDDEGVSILDKLVNAEVLFDPSLCNSDLSTAIYNVKDRKICINESCSAMLTTAQIKDSISYTEDVKVIHFGSFSFYSTVTGKSILEASFELNPKPIFYFNPALTKLEILEINNFKSNSILALGVSKIAQVNDDFLDAMFPNIDNKINAMMSVYPNLHVLYIKKNEISYLSSIKSSEVINITKSYKYNMNGVEDEKFYAIVASAFLSSLHENEIFGDELSEPTYAPSFKGLEQALDFVVKKIIKASKA